jgi:hypothetical protein
VEGRAAGGVPAGDRAGRLALHPEAGHVESAAHSLEELREAVPHARPVIGLAAFDEAAGEGHCDEGELVLDRLGVARAGRCPG